MAWLAGALAVAALALVGACAGLVRYFGANAREIERKLGEANGEIKRVQGLLDESIREREALKTALEHALRPRPTLDELQRVAAAQAGDPDLPADVGARVRVP